MSTGGSLSDIFRRYFDRNTIERELRQPNALIDRMNMENNEEQYDRWVREHEEALREGAQQPEQPRETLTAPRMWDSVPLQENDSVLPEGLHFGRPENYSYIIRNIGVTTIYVGYGDDLLFYNGEYDITANSSSLARNSMGTPTRNSSHNELEYFVQSLDSTLSALSDRGVLSRARDRHNSVNRSLTDIADTYRLAASAASINDPPLTPPRFTRLSSRSTRDKHGIINQFERDLDSLVGNGLTQDDIDVMEEFLCKASQKVRGCITEEERPTPDIPSRHIFQAPQSGRLVSPTVSFSDSYDDGGFVL